MGYARYENHEGRECGYAVMATCDQHGCSTQIDRGLAHLCGTTDAIFGGGVGCGGYFCAQHLGHVRMLAGGGLVELCEACNDDPEIALHMDEDAKE